MIYLDSGDLEEVEYYLSLGVIRGVTTNPTILRKDGITDIIGHTEKLCRLITPYPLSVEVTTNVEDEMIEQAKMFSKIGNNIVVKIPVQGPSNETYNLKVIKLLEGQGIRTNATACMSSSQAMMAGLANASFISIFGGRVSDIGHDILSEIRKTAQILEWIDPSPKLIIGSIRESGNIVPFLLAGADIITVTPNLMKNLITHPYSRMTVQQFLDDARFLETSDA